MGNRISGLGCRASKRVCFSLGSRSNAVTYIVFTNSESKLSFRVRRKRRMMILNTIDICRQSKGCRLCTERVVLSNTKLLCREFRTLGGRLRRVKVFTTRCGRPVPHCTHAVKIIATPAKTTVESVVGITGEEGPFIRVLLCPTLMRNSNTIDDVIGKVRVLRRGRISIVVIKENKKDVRSL